MGDGDVNGGDRLRMIRRAGVLLVCAVAMSACSPESDDAYPRFGFEATYDLPRVPPDEDLEGTLRCGTVNGGPTSSQWLAGPHDRFAELGSARLASESLAWFERSMQSAAWYGNPTARLELTYPSGALEVRVCQDASSELSWEEQLATWFGRFPPGGKGSLADADSGYSWEVEYPGRGEVYGRAETDAPAIKSMRELHDSGAVSPLFEGPKFSLTYYERRSSHAMDVYSVDAVGIEDLDRLPGRLEDKRAQWAWRTAAVRPR
jgi:hypothetical protein